MVQERAGYGAVFTNTDREPLLTEGPLIRLMFDRDGNLIIRLDGINRLRNLTKPMSYQEINKGLHTYI